MAEEHYRAQQGARLHMNDNATMFAFLQCECQEGDQRLAVGELQLGTATVQLPAQPGYGSGA